MHVMFMQSQSFFGADSQQQGLLMRGFDRQLVQPHVAVTKRTYAIPGHDVARHISAIPDLHVRPTEFGPSFFGTHGLERIKRTSALPRVPLSLLSLAAYVRRHRIQIIHSTEKPRDAFYASVLGMLTGAKTLVHVHVKYEDWMSPTVKWALRRADAIVGVSDYIAETVTAAGYPADRVFGVLNSLDLSSGRWDPTLDGRPARQSLGIPDDAPVIGIVARLFSWKGHDALVDALARVKQETPQVRLMIVGEDDPGAHPGGGSYRASLETRIRELGLQEQVIFTGFRADIPELMAAMDVYAMPSWEEPFGMVFLEAMAMKKPVVAWASGGVPEVILDGQTGFVVPPRSTDSLADALVRLLNDPALRRRFGEAGRLHVETRFAPQRMCHDMFDVYAHVAGAAALSGPSVERVPAA